MMKIFNYKIELFLIYFSYLPQPTGKVFNVRQKAVLCVFCCT